MKPYEIHAAVLMDHVLDFIAKCDVLGADTLILTRDLLTATLETDKGLKPADRDVIVAALKLLDDRLWEKLRDVLNRNEKDKG